MSRLIIKLPFDSSNGNPGMVATETGEPGSQRTGEPENRFADISMYVSGQGLRSSRRHRIANIIGPTDNGQRSTQSTDNRPGDTEKQKENRD